MRYPILDYETIILVVIEAHAAMHASAVEASVGTLLQSKSWALGIIRNPYIPTIYPLPNKVPYFKLMNSAAMTTARLIFSLIFLT